MSFENVFTDYEYSGDNDREGPLPDHHIRYFILNPGTP